MANEPKKAEKVISGTVTTKKKSEAHKLASVFLPGDVSDVKSYVLFDVIIPTLKRSVVDAVAMLLGEKRNKQGNNSMVDRLAYIDYSKIGSSSAPTVINHSSQIFDLGNLVFANYSDADLVLSTLMGYLQEYHIVTVSTLYELIGKQCPFTGNKYGWTKLNTAKIKQTRDGWMLCLPPAMPLD